MRRKVLFLCTHNSARSQMAEGLLRELAGDGLEVHSAGSVATAVRPEAVTVMGEVGVDLSQHRSKTLDRYVYERFDLVITVCDQARDTCPNFSAAGESRHWSIEDPAAVAGSPEERLIAFRAAREELDERICDEILAPVANPRQVEHFKKLERMYLSAPTNNYYRPAIHIRKGVARVAIDIRPEFHHGAGSVHGSVYFKALDDACFFAANSEVEEFLVLTSQFNMHLLRPVSEGRLIAVGHVAHSNRSSFLVAGLLHDHNGELLARGEGTFVKSRIRLEKELGYRLS